MNPPPPAAGDERLQFAFREHWIRLLPSILFASIVSLGAAVAGFMLLATPLAQDDTARRTILIVSAAIFGAAQLALFAIAIRHPLTLIVVTDRRVRRFQRTLFFQDDEQSVEIADVQNVDKRQSGFLPSLLGYGEIALRAEQTTLMLPFVPRVDRVYQNILDVLSRVKQGDNE